MNPQEKSIVKCPRCKQASVFSIENQYRPFCSERCKLIDLGQWASESYSIPAQPTSEAELEALEKITHSQQEDDGLN